MGLPQLAYPPHIRVFSIMPYPIPDNLDNIEGWRWYLVPLPDDDQMIQVAWGMWSELTHFWNWGKEGPVPEQSEKAAQLWAAALYEAWRIRDMGFPDLILTYIDEVEGLLRQIRDVGCCGPQDPTEGQFYTDAISDGVGDVPQNIIDAGFATDSTDWAGFDAYKCMIAHVIIDDAREKLTRLANLYDDEGLDFIGGAGAAAAILGFIFANLATGGAALVAGIIGASGAAAALYSWLNNVGSTVLTGIASDLDTNRDDIACAIYGADGPDAAISAFYSAVGSTAGATAETAVRLLNMAPVIRSLYSGRYDQQNIAQALADAGFSVGGYECCQSVVIGNGLLINYTHLPGSNNGGVAASVRTTFPADIELWNPAYATREVAVATTTAALDEIIAESEQHVSNLRYDPNFHLRVRNTSASTRNLGVVMELDKVFFDGVWRDVIGLVVDDITENNITGSVSGNTITVPVQNIINGAQIGFFVRAIIAT